MKIEFFATTEDVWMVDQDGRLRPFSKFSIDVLQRLRDEIEKDPAVEAALHHMGASGLDQIKQFIRCRFGAFNNQGDLVDGKMVSEYVDCKLRGNCLYEGIICRSELTAREMEVTRLIADDLADKQIADHLGISTFTVCRHRTRIEHKLNIASKIGIARFACLNQLNH